VSATTAFEVRHEDDVVAAVRDARSDGVRLAVRGHGSVLDRIGGPPASARVLATGALRGIVSYVPEDLIVTVRAGTPLSEVRAVLAEAGQECPLEPDPAALEEDGLTRAAGETAKGTVGGRLAAALAGPRQLNAGRVRDWVLRVRFVAGTGDVVTSGGVTVKDVTGYDLCRLLVGSWGAIGILTEVTLKLRPIARTSVWTVSDASDVDPIAQLYRPEAVLRSGERTWVRLEGHPDDVAADRAALGLEISGPPVLPASARLAVDPVRLAEVAREVRAAGVEVLTQDGVGVAHLGGDAQGITAARAAAERAGGALIVLDPALGLAPFGHTGVHDAEGDAAGTARLGGMAARVADALDPKRVLDSPRWER